MCIMCIMCLYFVALKMLRTVYVLVMEYHGILLEAQSIPGHPPVADVHLLALSLAVSNYSHSMASQKLQDKLGRQSIAIYCNLLYVNMISHDICVYVISCQFCACQFHSG